MYEYAETNFSINQLPISTIHSYSFAMEEEFQEREIFDLVQSYWYLTLPLVLVYILLIHLGVRYMRDRPKFHLRKLLFAWNAFLTFYYVFGILRVLPEVLHYLRHGEFYHLVCCHCPFGCTRVGYFWIWQFAWMKGPELLDTMFIVLRKQPLFFLHWYHHCTVLVFTFYLAKTMSSISLIFAMVNSFVHALMYLYYSFKSLAVRVPRIVSMTLTLVQLFQMVMGLFTIGYAFLVKQRGFQCFVSGTDMLVALFIYVSYFFLFSWYFYQAYIVKDALIISKFKGEKIQ